MSIFGTIHLSAKIINFIIFIKIIMKFIVLIISFTIKLRAKTEG